MTDIVTKRLTLLKTNPYDTVDYDTMIGWLNDPEVVRYSEQRHKHHTQESQQMYLLDGPDVFREIHAGNKFIGTISAYIDKANSVADVGILIGEKSEWGKGYGTEAWIAFCDSLFESGIRKIEAGAMSANLGMTRIFVKSRMTFEGFRDNHFVLKDGDFGRTCHMVLWGKFREAV